MLPQEPKADDFLPEELGKAWKHKDLSYCTLSKVYRWQTGFVLRTVESTVLWPGII